MSDEHDSEFHEKRQVTDAIIKEIHDRLDHGDERFEMLEASLQANTVATQQIAENTSGLVRLTTELEAGTKFLCRLAMAIRFLLKEVIEPFWKPALVVFVVISYIVNDHQLPQWVQKLLQTVTG